MLRRKEGELLPEGWSYTDTYTRIHVYYTDRNNGFCIKIAFTKEDANNPEKWSTSTEFIMESILPKESK